MGLLQEVLSEDAVGVFEDLSIGDRNLLARGFRDELALRGNGPEVGGDLLGLLLGFVPNAGGMLDVPPAPLVPELEIAVLLGSLVGDFNEGIDALNQPMAMHDTPIRVDHVGIAVHDVEPAETLLSALGCEKLADPEARTAGSGGCTTGSGTPHASNS